MFKTELHIHTAPVSNCAKTSAEAMVEDYAKNGYSTIVITNHFSPTLFKHVLKGTDHKAAVDLFLTDYHRAQDAARGRMNVLLGMEYRNVYNMNDYLVYGVTEKFLYDAEGILNLTIKEASQFMRENGMLVYQAHPFRNTMEIVKPDYLDGIEGGNFCTTHDSRNDIARIWADKFSMNMVFGSDYHSEKYMRGAGILTDREIKTNAELLEILKTMNFDAVDNGVTVFEGRNK